MRYYVHIILAAFSGSFTNHSNAQLTTMPPSATSGPSLLPSCSPTEYPSMEPSVEMSSGKKGSKSSKKSSKSSKKTSSKSPKNSSKGKGYTERCGDGKGKGGKGKGSSKSPKSSKGKGGKGKGYSETPVPSSFPSTFSTKSPSGSPNSQAPSLEVRKDEMPSDLAPRVGEEGLLSVVVSEQFKVEGGSPGDNSGTKKAAGIFSNSLITLFLLNVAYFAL